MNAFVNFLEYQICQFGDIDLSIKYIKRKADEYLIISHFVSRYSCISQWLENNHYCPT